MGRIARVKHREIFEHYHGRILAGEYRVGDRIPTETELASRFSTSRVTVARALRDLEQQGYLERRRGAGSFVRRPQNTASNLIGLITCGSAGIIPIVCDEISSIAQQSGFNVLLGQWPSGDVDRIIRYTHELTEQYISRRVAGVIFEPMLVSSEQVTVNAKIAEAFDKAGIAVVLLDRDLYDFPRRSSFDLVGVDNRGAGFLLTEYLLSLGYKRMCFLSSLRVTSTATARSLGFQEALWGHGIELSPTRLFRGDANDADWVRKIMKERQPDAFVCANDVEAATLMRTLGALGVRIPEDVAIVGMDDDPCARLLTVSLTTLRQPVKHLAASAVRLMLERLQDRAAIAREMRLACELVVRESCGATLRAKAVAG